MNDENWQERRYTHNESIVSRRIAEEYILVPIRQTAGEVDVIYTLNDVGARIWELIAEGNRLGEIAHQITREYDVSSLEAEEDVAEFVEKLSDIGALQELPSEMSSNSGG